MHPVPAGRDTRIVQDGIAKFLVCEPDDGAADLDDLTNLTNLTNPTLSHADQIRGVGG